MPGVAIFTARRRSGSAAACLSGDRARRSGRDPLRQAAPPARGASLGRRPRRAAAPKLSGTLREEAPALPRLPSPPARPRPGGSFRGPRLPPPPPRCLRRAPRVTRRPRPRGRARRPARGARSGPLWPPPGTGIGLLWGICPTVGDRPSCGTGRREPLGLGTARGGSGFGQRSLRQKPKASPRRKGALSVWRGMPGAGTECGVCGWTQLTPRARSGVSGGRASSRRWHGQGAAGIWSNSTGPAQLAQVLGLVRDWALLPGYQR